METGASYDIERNNARQAIIALEANGLRMALHKLPAVKLAACIFLCELLSKRHFTLQDAKVRAAMVNVINVILDFCETASTEDLLCIKKLIRVLKKEHVELLVEIANHVTREDGCREAGLRFVRIALQALKYGSHKCLTTDLVVKELQAQLQRRQLTHVEVSDNKVVGSNTQKGSMSVEEMNSGSLRDMQLVQKRITQVTRPRLFRVREGVNWKSQRGEEQSHELQAMQLEDHQGTAVWSQILMLYSACPELVMRSLKTNGAIQYIPEFVGECVTSTFAQVGNESQVLQMFRSQTCLLMNNLFNSETKIQLRVARKDVIRTLSERMDTSTSAISALDTHMNLFQEECLDVCASGKVVSIHDTTGLLHDIVQLCLSCTTRESARFLWSQTWIPAEELRKIFLNQLKQGKHQLDSVLFLWTEAKQGQNAASSTAIADQLFVSVLEQDDLLVLLLGHCKLSNNRNAAFSRNEPKTKKRRTEQSQTLLKLTLLLKDASSRIRKYSTSFQKELTRILEISESRYIWETFQTRDETSGAMEYGEKLVEALTYTRNALGHHLGNQHDQTDVLAQCICGTICPNTENKALHRCNCSIPQWTLFPKPRVGHWCIWSTMSTNPNTEHLRSETCLPLISNATDTATLLQKAFHGVILGNLHKQDATAATSTSLTSDVQCVLQGLLQIQPEIGFSNLVNYLENSCVTAVEQRGTRGGTGLKGVRLGLEQMWKLSAAGRCIEVSDVERCLGVVRSAERMLRVVCEDVREVEDCVEQMPVFVCMVVEIAERVLRKGGLSEFVYVCVLRGVNDVQREGEKSLYNDIHHCFKSVRIMGL